MSRAASSHLRASAHIARRPVSHTVGAAFRPAARSVRGVTTMAASFYDYSAKLLGTGTRDAPVDGASTAMSSYKGKVIMIQNVASL